MPNAETSFSGRGDQRAEEIACMLERSIEPFNRDPLGSVFRWQDRPQFQNAPQRVAVKHREVATERPMSD